MALEQFTYTGSPWGFSAPGWTVFQKSRGINPRAASELKPLFQFKESPAGTQECESINDRLLPVQLVFAENPATGGKLVAQSLDAGLRWYDQTRGKDYFAHVFCETPPGTAFDQVAPSFNPFAWFLSPSFQTDFPEEYREKALQIFRGELSNEPTPELPVLNSATELEANPYYFDDELFGRLTGSAFGKIGKLTADLVRRFNARDFGGIFFDGTKAASIDAMAATVRLLPIAVRKQLSFCTWIPASECKTFSVAKKLLFAGTYMEGAKADPDTGVYGELPTGGPVFKTPEEVEQFKRMVDACGEKLGAKDWDELVSCWEVASGRVKDSTHLRAAAKFAEQWKLEGEVEKGLSDKEIADEVALVAWFALRMGKLKKKAAEICTNYVQDAEKFAEALKKLEKPPAQSVFLNAVFEATKPSLTKDTSKREALVRRLDECADKIRGITASASEDFREFFKTVAEMKSRREGRPTDNSAQAERQLDEIAAAEKRYGPVFGDMGKVRKALRYCVAKGKVSDVEELAKFVEDAKGFEIPKEQIYKDCLAKFPLERLHPTKFRSAVEAYKAIEIDAKRLINSIPDASLLDSLAEWVDAPKERKDMRDAIIRRALDAAKKQAYDQGCGDGRKQGKDEAEKEIREQNKEMQLRAEEASRERSRRHVRAMLLTGLLGALLLALSFFVGYRRGGCAKMEAVEARDGNEVETNNMEELERERIARREVENRLEETKGQVEGLKRELEAAQKQARVALEFAKTMQERVAREKHALPAGGVGASVGAAKRAVEAPESGTNGTESPNALQHSGPGYNGGTQEPRKIDSKTGKPDKGGRETGTDQYLKQAPVPRIGGQSKQNRSGVRGNNGDASDIENLQRNSALPPDLGESSGEE